MKVGGTVLQVTITNSSTRTALYDLRAEYIALGYPAGAVVRLTFINNAWCQAGVDEGSGWPAGSTCSIVNASVMSGLGGDGGDGRDATTTLLGGGSVGSAGGDALNLSMPTTLDNAAGYLYGGGGGGGGGGAAADYNPPGTGSRAAGGGGGRGYSAAKGQGGYTAGAADGTDGTVGTTSARGTGGAGGVSFGNYGGKGGNGGDWGANGQSGSAASGPNTASARAGGAAGYAIRKNGHSLTITAGNNSTQIKGSVA